MVYNTICMHHPLIHIHTHSMKSAKALPRYGSGQTDGRTTSKHIPPPMAGDNKHQLMEIFNANLLQYTKLWISKIKHNITTITSTFVELISPAKIHFEMDGQTDGWTERLMNNATSISLHLWRGIE
ncbi:hypothetical protein DPMN_172487 [Dreissena polymorpha]|uniref:Uncharacterized protein n=1 Tax=Dreissena polymorpha TaxID=45954 RepID=A0A9D4IEP5_DREPO|nr:hypothetical protein DPMN_172487 [Dreissena polymorpha]